MVEPAEVHGKRIGMIAWGEKPDGGDDVAVFTGIADWDGTHLAMLREGGERFELRDEWLERLKPVVPKLREMLLGAEYSFNVTVGSLPEGAGPGEFEKLRLGWPKTDEPGEPRS